MTAPVVQEMLFNTAKWTTSIVVRADALAVEIALVSGVCRGGTTLFSLVREQSLLSVLPNEHATGP
jgi:hypothetical protein